MSKTRIPSVLSAFLFWLLLLWLLLLLCLLLLLWLCGVGGMVADSSHVVDVSSSVVVNTSEDDSFDIPFSDDRKEEVHTIVS